MNLTKYEQETIINFNAGEKTLLFSLWIPLLLDS